MCVVWYIYIFISIYIYICIYVDIDWSPSCCKSAESAQTSRFQVKVEALEETLDRFARFFSEPLLTKAPGRHFGCVMRRWYFFWRSCHVLFYAWKKMMTPHLYEKKRQICTMRVTKAMCFFFFAIFTDHCWDPCCPWKGLHRKRNQRRRFWVPSRRHDMRKMVCYFRLFALFARPLATALEKSDIFICQLCQLLEMFWCLCIESAYLCHPINDIETCDHLALTRPWDA